uniref:Pre-rRNA-processing protein TSR2 homolog n=1 Tax=Globisporangium ultimum (strain ATCC 200006 / CBS 805.95 / DAOM BR144) TaxID=431595 RepID=K3X674_GLOUD
MSGTESVLLAVAREHSEAFQMGTIKSPWEYFEYAVKLALSRWTALRFAIEGEWGGGDMRRKYEILLEEILHVFKYNKTVYPDDMVINIADYVESEFGLLCEDGSVEELSELLVVLAEECKKGDYARVRMLHDQVRTLFPINLKGAKVRAEGDATMEGHQSTEGLEGIQEEQEDDAPMVDADGFTTVRRSLRRKAAPKFYDPSVTFPGAE